MFIALLRETAQFYLIVYVTTICTNPKHLARRLIQLAPYRGKL